MYATYVYMCVVKKYKGVRVVRRPERAENFISPSLAKEQFSTWGILDQVQMAGACLNGLQKRGRLLRNVACTHCASMQTRSSAKISAQNS